MALPERSPRYTALIGDLVRSREHPERDRLQRELRAVLQGLNAGLGEGLVRPFTVTAGDEFQVLAARAEPLVAALVTITERLFALGPEVQLAVGVGHGTVDTAIDPAPPPGETSPALLDGPCFHRARAALEDAARHRAWVRWRGFEPPADRVLDGLFDLMQAVRSGWTANQGATVQAMRRLGVQKLVAEELGGVRPSVVSESLKAARYEAVRAGEEAARALLAR